MHCHYNAPIVFLLADTVHNPTNTHRFHSIKFAKTNNNIDDIPRIGRVGPATFLGNELRLNICLSLVINGIAKLKIISIFHDVILNKVIYYLLFTWFLVQIQHILQMLMYCFFFKTNWICASLHSQNNATGYLLEIIKYVVLV